MTEQTDLVILIDEALERFGTRDLVSGSEVLDFLLDLRLAVLLEEEREPATS